MKRAVDIFGAIVAIILFSPVMLLTALLIKLTSPGPVIFCQERVGLHNRPFKCTVPLHGGAGALRGEEQVDDPP